ncbi:MAG: polyamine aminopropyltransferase [Deltaproteobacteria bacterium]
MSKEFSIKGKKWFLETSFPGVRRCKRDSFMISKPIFKGKSRFQNIEIFESPGFGKMLALDGIIQLSQSDEFIYHEMMSHVPLLSMKDPRRVLVIGGGDGGVLRESTKHPLEKIDFVDIDGEVVKLCRKHLGFISKGAFDDKRVDVLIQDGIKFIKGKKNYYDLVVVDSTDPVGPGKVLFSAPFYRMVYDSLTKDGMAIFQLGPFLDFNLIIKPTAKKLGQFFKYINCVRLPMPSYSCGCEYCFMLASKSVDPASLDPELIRERLAQRLKGKAASLKYYTPEVHTASMVLPKLWQL